jgi:hypothetical protein
MEFIIRRNFRHNGKVYMQGSRINFPVLDEAIRINLRAGVLEKYIEPLKKTKKPEPLEVKESVKPVEESKKEVPEPPKAVGLPKDKKSTKGK